MSTEAWVLVADFTRGTPGAWPDGTGDFGPPDADDEDVLAAISGGQEFVITNDHGEVCFAGRAWPDASDLPECFRTEEGEFGVDPGIASNIVVLPA